MIHQQAEIRMVHHLEAGGTFCLAFEECLATSGRGFVKLPAVVLEITMAMTPKTGRTRE